MKNRFLTALIILLACAANAIAQTPTLKWEYRYNDGSVNQNDRFNDMKVDAALNAYVTGYTMGQTTNYDYLTAKVDNDGNQVWAQTYNGPGNGLDEVYKLVMDNAGAVYLTGKSLGSGTGFDWATIKYNSSGVQQWAERYNHATANIDEYPNSIIFNTNGNLLITGVMPTPSGPPAPYTGLGMICREYSAQTGQFVTDQTPQTENSSGIGFTFNIPYGTALRNDGIILFARESYTGAQAFSRITLRRSPVGPVPTASAVYPPSSQALSSSDLNKPNGIILDASENSYTFGYTDIVYGSGENTQAIVIKHNLLQEQWTTPAIFGGAGTGRDEALDAKEYNGDIYAVGYADMDATAGVNNDFLIAKINGSTGAIVWQQTYHRGNDDRAFKLHVSSLGNIYIVGQTVNANGNKDITLVMYNNSGVFQWEKHYNGPGNGNDIPTALHVSTAANDITISGVSVGSGSQDDAIVLRYCVPPIPDAGPDKGFCSGGSTTIGTTALPNHTYLWTPATGLSSATAANPTLTLTNLTTCPVDHEYILKVTNANGCFDYDTVMVTVYHYPVVSIVTSQPNVICENEPPIIITPTISTGCQGTPSYAWKQNGNQVSTSASAYSVSTPPQSGSYTLTVTNSYGATSCATTSNSVSATVNLIPVGTATPSTSAICIGDATSIQLGSSINSTTYTWTASGSGSSNGSGSSISQTLNIAGSAVYTITPTVTTTGCVGNNFTATVTVNPLPVVPTITASGATEFCAGGSVMLTSSAASSYSWSPTGGSSVSTNVNTTGAYAVTITDANGCGNTSAAMQITVNANPVVNAGIDKTFCAGYANFIGGNPTASGGQPTYVYTWSNGSNLDDATLANPNLLTTLTSGSYNFSVSVEDDNGCTGIDQVLVTVLDELVADAGSDATICVGDSVQLIGSGGDNFIWSPTVGLSTSTISEPMASPTDTTEFQLVVSASGCDNDTAWVTVNVNELPAQPTVTVSGLDITCNESGYSYQWNLNGNELSGETGQSLTNANQNGDYTVTITDGNGCSSTSDPMIPVGIEGSIADAMNIFPNPTNGRFDILLPNIQGQLRYEVFSAVGQMVHGESLTSERTSINLQGAAEGIYIIRIVDDNGQMLGMKRVVLTE